jgi:hypothetical protein
MEEKKIERFLQLRIDTEADCVREGDFNEGVFFRRFKHPRQSWEQG